MANDTILGLECNVMLNSASFASPTWAAVEAIKDASLDYSRNKVDASRRGSGGWRLFKGTLQEATLNLTIIKDKDDTAYVALETAAKAGTPIELAVLDGADASGTDWLDAYWEFESWNETQDLEGVVTIEAVAFAVPDADLTPTFGSDALPTTRS